MPDGRIVVRACSKEENSIFEFLWPAAALDINCNAVSVQRACKSVGTNPCVALATLVSMSDICLGSIGKSFQSGAREVSVNIHKLVSLDCKSGMIR
jgi:hypothetical protein